MGNTRPYTRDSAVFPCLTCRLTSLVNTYSTYGTYGVLTAYTMLVHAACQLVESADGSKQDPVEIIKSSRQRLHTSVVPVLPYQVYKSVTEAAQKHIFAATPYGSSPTSMHLLLVVVRGLSHFAGTLRVRCQGIILVHAKQQRAEIAGGSRYHLAESVNSRRQK